MMETHRFFCVKCGREGVPLPRSQAKQRGKMHRKKLYCIYCGQELNMVECYDERDVRRFKKNFERGLYEKEAEESFVYCGGRTK